MTDGEKMDVSKCEALRVTRQYLNLRKTEPVYYNEEKDAHYRFALVMAMRELRDGNDTPLNTLYNSLRKYDEWAHKKGESSYIYSLAVSAIDDLIDYILTDD